MSNPFIETDPNAILVEITSLDDIEVPLTVDQDLTCIEYTDESCGVITSRPIEDLSGIELTIVPTLPVDYNGIIVVLRGKYEYKRDFQQEPLQILYVLEDPLPENTIIISDKTVEPLTHYYYSILVLCQDDLGNDHYRYNPLTGFTSCYRLNDYDTTSYMLGSLPEKWRESEFSDRYVQIFATIADGLRSDIDAYMKTAHSIQDIEEKLLPFMSHLIGWEVNKELTEQEQRDEVRRAPTVYAGKGKNEILEYLIQNVTGFDVYFEDGYSRVIRNGEFQSPHIVDTYANSHQGLPWITTPPDSIGVSGGLPSESYNLSNGYVRNVRILVDGVEWEEVEDFTASSPTDQHYTLSGFGSPQTITFGDGVNGVIPTLGDTIVAYYQYGGDKRQYCPRYPESWLNDCGLRIILEETVDSKAITSPIMNKITKIVADFKPVHTLTMITFIVSNVVAEDEVEVAEDDYDEYVEVSSLEIITDTTVGETQDTEDIIVW